MTKSAAHRHGIRTRAKTGKNQQLVTNGTKNPVQFRVLRESRTTKRGLPVLEDYSNSSNSPNKHSITQPHATPHHQQLQPSPKTPKTEDSQQLLTAVQGSFTQASLPQRT
ncbi:hypothetical protein Nepgr_021413 [Nepenthes gracilis]|uniref:Uncharacterized protein n=1 Tax=Nepenthes gracilis TaxID=150966 RepID=A0AAD3XVX5_NEPGR|nr:hypothetical protein Nepgr_021413 [Nepenthes gracilis]